MEETQIKAHILTEIEKTEQLIAEFKGYTKPIAPDEAIGRISRMDAINNKSINDYALRKAEEKLLKLNQVLEKVGTPQFGICIKCKKNIPIGRILLIPESPYCVNCVR